MTIPIHVNQMLNNFPMYLSATNTRQYFARYELFKMILDIPGSIMECGVSWGGGLLSWLHFAFMFEPGNFTRQVWGFDTFDPENNFPRLSEYDPTTPASFPVDADHLQEVLSHWVDVHLPGREKAFLIKGDAYETIPKWCEDNPGELIALAYLDFDVYDPTATAIQYFWKRMPKGALLVFDELSYYNWPGETVALLDNLLLSDLVIKRIPYAASMAYIVK